MNDINRSFFTGTLGRDIELKYSAGDMAIASFSIAVNSSRKDKKTDNWINEVEWINVKAFGRLAEDIAKRAGKGFSLLVAGRFKEEKWETKDGEKRSRVVIMADSIEVLDRPRKGAAAETPAAGGTRTDTYEHTDLEPF